MLVVSPDHDAACPVLGPGPTTGRLANRRVGAALSRAASSLLLAACAASVTPPGDDPDASTPPPDEPWPPYAACPDAAGVDDLDGDGRPVAADPSIALPLELDPARPDSSPALGFRGGTSAVLGCLPGTVEPDPRSPVPGATRCDRVLVVVGGERAVRVTAPVEDLVGVAGEPLPTGVDHGVTADGTVYVRRTARDPGAPGVVPPVVWDLWTVRCQRVTRVLPARRAAESGQLVEAPSGGLLVVWTAPDRRAHVEHVVGDRATTLERDVEAVEEVRRVGRGVHALVRDAGGRRLQVLDPAGAWVEAAGAPGDAAAGPRLTHVRSVYYGASASRPPTEWYWRDASRGDPARVLEVDGAGRTVGGRAVEPEARGGGLEVFARPDDTPWLVYGRTGVEPALVLARLDGSDAPPRRIPDWPAANPWLTRVRDGWYLSEGPTRSATGGLWYLPADPAAAPRTLRPPLDAARSVARLARGPDGLVIAALATDDGGTEVARLDGPRVGPRVPIEGVAIDVLAPGAGRTLYAVPEPTPGGDLAYALHELSAGGVTTRRAVGVRWVVALGPAAPGVLAVCTTEACTLDAPPDAPWGPLPPGVAASLRVLGTSDGADVPGPGAELVALAGRADGAGQTLLALDPGTRTARRLLDVDDALAAAALHATDGGAWLHLSRAGEVQASALAYLAPGRLDPVADGGHVDRILPASWPEGAAREVLLLRDGARPVLACPRRGGPGDCAWAEGQGTRRDALVDRWGRLAALVVDGDQPRLWRPWPAPPGAPPSGAP